MQLTHRSMVCQALSDDRHEQLGEWGSHRYTPIVVHVQRITTTLVKGCHSSIPPRLGGFLVDGTIRQEVGKGFVVLSP